MRKNSVVKDTDAVTPSSESAIPVGNPPPKDNAPAVPANWVKSKRFSGKKGLKPTTSQADASPGAAAEMQATTTWVADFGSKAPDPKVIASKLNTASSWRDAWSLAMQWLAYCAEQRGLWEDDAFNTVAELKPLFDYASERDATIAKRYPSTKLIVGARSASAQRGANTRKKKAKTAARAKAVVPDLAVSSTAPASGSSTSH